MHKYILQLISIIFTISLLFINVYVMESIKLGLVLGVLIGLLIISLILNGYRRPDKRDFIYKEIFVVGLAILLQCAFYLVSWNNGFDANYSTIFKNYIAKSTILMTFGIVFVREVIRYIVVNINTRKKYQNIIKNILFIIMCILIDLSIASRIYSLTSFTLIYEFIAMIIIPSAAKNILLNYLSKDNGFILTFSYVLVMDLYIYFMPVLPNLNMLLEAVVLLVFPYFVYNFYNKFTERRKLLPKRKEKKKDSKIVNILSIIIFGILVCLVSREFKYSMIGIGSESMTGTINKGDAIIYRKYEGNENLKDKVIVFKKSGVLIVHRVIKAYILEDYMIYQTKGDFNDSPDSWVVTDKEIVGIVEKRVPWIAWPSVWLNEIF